MVYKIRITLFSNLLLLKVIYTFENDFLIVYIIRTPYLDKKLNYALK